LIADEATLVDRFTEALGPAMRRCASP
jgi:hypothetical protein